MTVILKINLVCCLHTKFKEKLLMTILLSQILKHDYSCKLFLFAMLHMFISIAEASPCTALYWPSPSTESCFFFYVKLFQSCSYTHSANICMQTVLGMQLSSVVGLPEYYHIANGKFLRGSIFTDYRFLPFCRFNFCTLLPCTLKFISRI